MAFYNRSKGLKVEDIYSYIKNNNLTGENVELFYRYLYLYCDNVIRRKIPSCSSAFRETLTLKCTNKLFEKIQIGEEFDLNEVIYKIISEDAHIDVHKNERKESLNYNFKNYLINLMDSTKINLIKNPLDLLGMIKHSYRRLPKSDDVIENSNIYTSLLLSTINTLKKNDFYNFFDPLQRITIYPILYNLDDSYFYYIKNLVNEILITWRDVFDTYVSDKLGVGLLFLREKINEN